MIADRVTCTTSTTGTGNLTLSATGIRDTTFGDSVAPAETIGQTFSLANRLVTYFITNGNNFCRGTGVISSNGLTLVRDNAEVSWNGVAFSVARLNLVGSSIVAITPGCDDIAAGSIGVSMNIARGIFSF